MEFLKYVDTEELPFTCELVYIIGEIKEWQQTMWERLDREGGL